MKKIYVKLDRELNPQFYSNKMKLCKICKTEKSLLEFPIDRALCNICFRQHEWNRRAKNSLKGIWQAAKRRAAKNGIEFSITEQDIADVWRDTCPIFGITLKRNQERAKDNSPSLDRINNDKGYVPGNIAIVSQKFNTMKRELTPTVLRLMLQYIENPLSVLGT